MHPLEVGQQVFSVVVLYRAHTGNLLVEVLVNGFDLGDVELPGPLVFQAAGKAVGLASSPGFLKIELFNPDRFGFAVVFDARRVRVLAVPNIGGGLAMVKNSRLVFMAA